MWLIYLFIVWQLINMHIISQVYICYLLVNTYYCLKIYSKNQILTKIYTSISIVSYNNLEEKRHEKHYI